MKNLTLAIAFCSLFSGVFASNGKETKKENIKESDKQKSSVYEQIIAYPPNIRYAHEKEIVLVSFNVEPCGHIHILESNSSNPEFLAYVTSKLEAAQLSYDEVGAETQYLKFVFLSL